MLRVLFLNCDCEFWRGKGLEEVQSIEVRDWTYQDPFH